MPPQPPPPGGPSPYGYTGPPPPLAMPPQPQPSAGYPPQPGPYFGQQPPPPPGGPYFVPTPGPAFVPTGDRKAKRKNALIGLAIAALFISGGVALAVFGDNSAPADQAKVGDCLHNRGNKVDPDLVVTDCGTSDADFKVVSLPGDDANTCPHGQYWYQETQNGDPLVTLCVSEISG